MKPLPWSHSALEDFVGCPRRYHATKVAKSVPREAPSQAQTYGLRVHEAFERCLRDGQELPADLMPHAPALQALAALPGDTQTEQRIALNRDLEPCGFFGHRVWFRGVIDLINLDNTHAVIVDYKTGKPHQKFAQLKLFGLYAFHAYPGLETVEACYYWTQPRAYTRERYTREMLPLLWQAFIPSLKQYAEAFHTDTWTPRPSGLCGWCPLASCEFHVERRR